MRLDRMQRRARRTARRAMRGVSRWRPTTVVGALFLGAVLGAGVTGAVAVSTGHDDPPAIHGSARSAPQDHYRYGWPEIGPGPPR